MANCHVEVLTTPPLALPNNGEMQATDSHVEVLTTPPLALPNNGEIQATAESSILAIPLLIAIMKAAPSTINASARFFNALARFTHELPRFIRTVRALKRKPKTPDKK